jgi:signal transduction histidine kinase
MANHAKSRFLANMSHELRTPLNAVLGFSEVMMSEILGPIGSPRYREYAADIHRSGGHLLDLVNDVLDLSRLEQGMVELREERVALAPFVADTMRLVAMPAQSAAVELAVRLPDQAPDLLIDPRALRQVLVNLVANAIKFTEPGGAVTLSAVAAAAGGFEFAVSDTGRGIPADRLDAIFEPFHQVDPQVTNPGRGVGLGLAIARALVDAHGGRISAASTVAVGSVFTVALPPERVLAPRFYRRA